MARKLKLPLLYVSMGLKSSALPLLFLLKIIRPSANNKIVKKNWVGLIFRGVLRYSLEPKGL